VTLQVIKDHHATDLFVPKNESLYFKVKKTTTFEGNYFYISSNKLKSMNSQIKHFHFFFRI